jgi:hypothetical protein
MMAGRGAVILPVVVAIMVSVGVVAALGPARRGPRVHPDAGTARRLTAPLRSANEERRTKNET